MNLNVEHLSFSYGKRPILQDVCFTAAPGEFLSVLGPNGVGKSTLFRCILGILTDYSGRITVDDTDLRSLSRQQQAKRIAYIPQIHRPTFGYTVLDTVLMGTTRQVSLFSQPSAKQIEQAHAALQQLGVGELADRNFSHLSGGEQQLVLVARAIVQQADILIMDEPTSALDYGNQLRVLQKVKQLADDGYSVLLSTHNPQHAMSFATRILALAGGQVAAFGTPDEVLTTDLVRRLYGVEVSFVETAQGRLLAPQMNLETQGVIP